MGYVAAEEVIVAPAVQTGRVSVSNSSSNTNTLPSFAALGPQVTLPARFMTTTAHLIAILTILIDVVSRLGLGWWPELQQQQLV